MRGTCCDCLFEADEFHIEDESGVWWDYSRVALLAVSVVRGAGQFGALAYRHLSNTLVPSSDDFSLADLEFEGLATVARRVEFLPICQCACIVDHHCLPGLWVS